MAPPSEERSPLIYKWAVKEVCCPAKMKSFVVFIILLSWMGVLHCAFVQDDKTFLKETLKKLSTEGEKYVDKEVKQALTGVKQMKVFMEKRQETHEDLMESLKQSSEKKKDALQLAQEVEQKLEEAEDQCEASLQSFWEECKPCLENACKTFFTTSCRRGFSTFAHRVEEFFRRMSTITLPFPHKQGTRLNEDIQNDDAEMAQIESFFSQLISDVGFMFDKSIELFKKLQREFDHTFQASFVSDLEVTSQKSIVPAASDRKPAFFEGLGLDHLIRPFFDFSRVIFEGFHSVITEAADGLKTIAKDLSEKVQGSERSKRDFLKPLPRHDQVFCKELWRNSSGCLQLQEQCEPCQQVLSQECPSVPELFTELSEATSLVNVSIQQYEQVVQIVQLHAEDTANSMRNMKERFGWVTKLAKVEPENIFSINSVQPSISEEDAANPVERTVEVNVLSSPILTFKVPQELGVDDPKFIEYVVEKALDLYKQTDE
nr:PREDICTED: clusterin-like protein 1 [Latimeria chalumnae]|eukprot:XP_005995776.1 PREDICTED: clusterin-like protein 1 [Latimeria chalumnae]